MILQPQMVALLKLLMLIQMTMMAAENNGEEVDQEGGARRLE
jgi:hypothetical protein